MESSKKGKGEKKEGSVNYFGVLSKDRVSVNVRTVNEERAWVASLSCLFYRCLLSSCHTGTNVEFSS